MTHLKFDNPLRKLGQKTFIVTVYSKHDESRLGLIKWKAQWRCYCFFPDTKYETFWSYECLDELSDYILDMNLAWKAENKRRKQK